MDAEKLTAAIAAVNVVTGIVKPLVPRMAGRWTQALALGLSAGAAFAVAGTGDAWTIVGYTLAIFGGAVAAHKVLKLGK